MIWLVRHGQTAYNKERRLQGQRDIPLAYEGLLQAEELALKLKKEGPRVGALYCSTLSRARVTAEIIGRQMGLEPITIKGVEEIFFGSFQGHTFAEIETLFPEEYAAYMADRANNNSHGGENPGEVLSRAREAIFALPEAKTVMSGGDASALVVCHGAVIAFLRAASVGRPLEEIIDLIPDNAQLIPLGRDELERIANYTI